MTIYVSSGKEPCQSVDQATKLFKLHNQIRGVWKTYISGLVEIIKHSFAHLEALLFLFVKALYQIRLLFSTLQK